MKGPRVVAEDSVLSTGSIDSQVQCIPGGENNTTGGPAGREVATLEWCVGRWFEIAACPGWCAASGMVMSLAVSAQQGIAKLRVTSAPFTSVDSDQIA